MFNNFFKQKKIISEEDERELIELERKAYMEEAKKLIQERGKERAKAQLSTKQVSNKPNLFSI
jgi:hypothetical protein